MSTRLTRNQPFCWQEKKILRLFRVYFQGNELAKYRNLYGTLTEMDSDFNGQEIKFYTKTIATYSGLNKEWIPKAVQNLEKMKILSITQKRDDSGRFTHRHIIFTPENIKEIDKRDLNTENTVTGKTVIGKTAPLEDSTYLEDSNKKDINETKDIQEDSIESPESIKSNSQAKKPAKKTYKNDLIDTIYLSQPNVIKHNNNSKTYKHCNLIINSLMKGTFKKQIKYMYSNAEINLKWFNLHKLTELLTKKFTEEEIKHLFVQFNNYLDKSYYPCYKGIKAEKVYKQSLEAFLFNVTSGKSMALKCFKYPPKKGNQIVKSKCPEIQAIYNKALMDTKVSETEKRSITLSINDFFDSVEKKLLILKENHYNIKCTGSIYSEHASWVKNKFSKLSGSYHVASLISTENKFWGSFNTFLTGTYGQDLEPSTNTLRSLRKSYDRTQRLQHEPIQEDTTDYAAQYMTDAI
jgi:hypothetical protein